MLVTFMNSLLQWFTMIVSAMTSLWGYLGLFMISTFFLNRIVNFVKRFFK